MSHVALYTDLCILAVLMGEGEVVLIDGSQTPVSELDEAISPASEVRPACRV